MPDREAIWKLVEARCTQLADSVASARTPFLLALTWSFVWAWALYGYEFGYLNVYRERYEGYYADLLRSPFPKANENLAKFKEVCIDKEVIPGLKNEQFDNTAQEICAFVITERFKWAENEYIRSTRISFPFGFGTASIGDLGQVAQFGLLLILSWCFFAIRRQNHAISAIVDIPQNELNLNRWFPTSFTLISKESLLSAQHVAYAYHSVAQRFMFLFSQYSRPLLAFTIAPLCFPAIIMLWNLWTDLRDTVLRNHETTTVISNFFEIAVAVAIAVLTWRIVRFEIATSVLLNGWYLASRDVWMAAWDKGNDVPASPVMVDVIRQIATPLTGTSTRAKK